MEIAFRVRDVEVPEGLRRRTRDRVARLAEQCGARRAVVFFSEERNPRIAERQVCQITLFGRGHSLRVLAAARDLTLAADRTVAKLELRAARLRGRQAGRRHLRGCGGIDPAALPADSWVHFPTNRSTARREPAAVDLLVGGPGGVGGMGSRDPGTDPLTPEEAALEMAELGRDLYFFINAETGRPAVVYSRRDGNIAYYDCGAGDPAGPQVAQATSRW